MHWLWIVLGVLGAIVSVMAVVGSITPAEHVAARSAVFRKGAQEIWARLTDIREFPTWRTDIKSVELLPEENGHITWSETGKWGAMKMARIEEEAPNRLVTEIADTDQAFGGRWTMELTPVDGGTRLVITERGIVHNVFFRFMARYIFGYTATIDGYLEALGRALGEQAAPTDAAPPP